MNKMSVEKALIKGLKEALEFEKGEKRLKTTFRELPDPAPDFSPSKIRKIRKGIFSMTQEDFAIVLNITTSTLRSWEQGTRKPSDSALRLLQLLILNPDIIKTLKKSA